MLGLVEVPAIAVVTATACALPGCFLLLRRQALLSDAISHVVLLGIVGGFLVTGRLGSPWLLFGAALSGVVTVALVEALQRTDRVREDAAIGLVFPALFSVAVILVTGWLPNVHLDTDMVLAGDLANAVLDTVTVGRYSLGPRALLVMSGILAGQVLLVVLAFKELKLATFDAALAETLGYRPVVIHYALMTMVALTAVAAFDAVGAPLVVALMIVPAMTAYLLTDRLAVMLVVSGGVAALAALLGVGLAEALPTEAARRINYAGAMTTALGALFVLAWFLAPRHGLLVQWVRRRQQRRVFFNTMLTVHLLHHEGTTHDTEESQLDTLHDHLRWRRPDVRRVAHRCQRAGWIVIDFGRLRLTDTGRQHAQAAVVNGPQKGAVS